MLGILSPAKKRIRVVSLCALTAAVVSAVFAMTSYQDLFYDNADSENFVGTMAVAELGSDAPPSIADYAVSKSNPIAEDLEFQLRSNGGKDFDPDALRLWLSQLSDEEIVALQPFLASWMQQRLALLENATHSDLDALYSRNVASVFDVYIAEFARRDGAEALLYISNLPLELGAVPHAQSAISAWHQMDADALEDHMLKKARTLSSGNPDASAIARKELQYYFEYLNQTDQIDLAVLMAADGLPSSFVEMAISTVVTDDRDGDQLHTAAQAVINFQSELRDPYIFQTIAQDLAKGNVVDLIDWVNQIDSMDNVEAIATGIIREAAKKDTKDGIALLTSPAFEQLASLVADDSDSAVKRQGHYLNEYVTAALTRLGSDKTAARHLYQQVANIDHRIAEDAVETIRKTLQLRYGPAEVERLSATI